MFYYKIPYFHRDFKNENLCFLNRYSVHTARILDFSLEVISNPTKRGTEHLYNSKGFSFMPEQV